MNEFIFLLHKIYISNTSMKPFLFIADFARDSRGGGECGHTGVCYRTDNGQFGEYSGISSKRICLADRLTLLVGMPIQSSLAPKPIDQLRLVVRSPKGSPNKKLTRSFNNLDSQRCVRLINNVFNLANVIHRKTFPVPRLIAMSTGVIICFPYIFTLLL